MSCVLPWIHLATAPSGTLRQCCVIDQNFVPKKPNGDHYRLSRKSDLEEFWNSPEMRQLRLNLLADKKPDSCRRCWRDEELGITSLRQSTNLDFSEKYQQLANNTTADGSTPLNLVYFDLRFGNLCNLKCRMCSPYSSDQFLDEWNLANPEDALSPTEINRLRNLRWWENPNTWDALIPHLDNLELIYSTGGEPTLAEGFYKFMDLCIDQKYSSNITVKINTNLTNFSDKLIMKLEKFKSVKLNLSIDAVGPLARYVRHPSNWSAIEKNLKKIDQLVVEKKWQGTVQTTVQAITISRLTELFDCIKNLQGVCRFPALNILDNPAFLNICVLPKHTKEMIAENLMKWYETHKTVFHRPKEQFYFSKLPAIVDYMLNDDRENLLPTLATRTYRLDALRDEKLADVLPEINEILKRYL